MTLSVEVPENGQLPDFIRATVRAVIPLCPSEVWRLYAQAWLSGLLQAGWFVEPHCNRPAQLKDWTQFSVWAGVKPYEDLAFAAVLISDEVMRTTARSCFLSACRALEVKFKRVPHGD